VIGPPRSGTTWVAQALSHAEGAVYVHEPDGDSEVFALRAKLGRPRHLELAPGARDRIYERLWGGAFAGGRRNRRFPARLAERIFDQASFLERRDTRRSGRPEGRMRLALALARPLRAEPKARTVVVKSVHACLAAEWVAERFHPRVLVVERHPLNVLASWDQLHLGLDRVEYEHLRAVAQRRWGCLLPPVDAPAPERQAAFLGVLQGALNESAAAHPEWVRVCHDDLLDDPQPRFERLCADLGIDHSTAVAAFLAESDRPGEGYVTRRERRRLVERWRGRLAPGYVAGAVGVLERFPSELRLLERLESGYR
jgi:hypothetical protein